MEPQVPKPPQSTTKQTALRAHRKVTITTSGDDSLEVTPEFAHVGPPGRSSPHKVRWEIAADVVPAGGRLEIGFKEYNGTRGPFPPGGGNSHGRGRYRVNKKASMVIVSSNTDVFKNPKSDGHWYYQVEVFDRNDQRVRFVDPGVAIDEDPELKPGS